MRATQAGAGLFAVAMVGLVLGLAGPTPSTAAQAGPAVKEFSVTAERFRFTPDRLEVNQGDTVRITAWSADGTHGFEIKKLKVEKLIPRGGETVVIEFVADKAGTFQFKCSEYCGRGHSGMTGVLVVTESSGSPTGSRLRWTKAASALSWETDGPGTTHYDFGIEKRMGGHEFQLNFSDSFGTTLAQIARGGTSPRHWYLGFNITRKFY